LICTDSLLLQNTANYHKHEWQYWGYKHGKYNHRVNEGRLNMHKSWSTIKSSTLIVYYIFTFNRISGIVCQFSNFSAISWREQVNFQWNDEVRLVLDQHAELDFYSASLLKQQSAGRHVALLNHVWVVTGFIVSTCQPFKFENMPRDVVWLVNIFCITWHDPNRLLLNVSGLPKKKIKHVI
jgi:hypothetical protein